MKTMDCKTCNKKFSRKSSLKKHLKNRHPEVDIDLLPQFQPKPQTEAAKAKAKHVCDVCSKAFTRLQSMHRHKIQVHKLLEFETKKASIEKRIVSQKGYKCFGCPDKMFQNREDITKHYTSQHGLTFDVQEVTFKNHSDFFKWKHDTERQTASFYSLQGKYTTKTSITHSYECNCSGEFKSVSKGKRHSKYKGSIKSGSFCPARMLYVVPIGGDDINVKFTSTHVGHQCQYNRLRISKPDKEAIAAQLRAGASIEKILQKSTENTSEPNRLSFLRKKDILNIAATYGIEVPEHSKSRMGSSKKRKTNDGDASHQNKYGEQGAYRPNSSKQRNTNDVNATTYGVDASKQSTYGMHAYGVDASRQGVAYGVHAPDQSTYGVHPYGVDASRQRNANDPIGVTYGVHATEQCVSGVSYPSLSCVENYDGALGFRGDNIEKELYSSTLKNEANQAVSRAMAVLIQNFSEEKCRYFINALGTISGNLLNWGSK